MKSNKASSSSDSCGGSISEYPEAEEWIPRTNRRMTTFLGIAFLIAAFALALFFTGYMNILYAPALLCLLGLAGITIIPAIWKGLKIPVGIPAITLFVFWLYVTTTLIWTSIPFTSLVTWLILSTLPLVFFSLLIAPRRDVILKRTGITLMGALALLAGWAVFDYLILGGGIGGRAHAPLPNPNTLAGLMNLGLLPALVLFFSFRKHEILKLALALLFFAALLATESRGGIISGGIAIAVLLISLRSTLCKKKLLAFIITASLIFTAFQFSGQAGQRLTALSTPLQESEITSRLAIWHSTVEMIKEHPLTGTGLGTFFHYYPTYRAPDIDNSTGHWAHNDPLQYAAEMGIIAPLLFYIFLLSVLIRTITALRTLPPDSELRAPLMGLFCALLAVGIHTHATFHLYILSILIVCGVWLAGWYALTDKALQKQPLTPRALHPAQKVLLTIATLSFITLLGGMALSSAAGMHFVLQAKTAIQQGRVADFQTALDKARTYGPATLPDPDVMQAGLYIDLLKNPVLFNEEEQEMMGEEASALLARAALLNPAWAEITHKQAKLYMIQNEKKAAFEAWKAALEKNPQHHKSRKALAQLYMAQGQALKAYEILEDGLHYPRSRAVDAALKNLMKEIRPLTDIQRQYQK